MAEDNTLREYTVMVNGYETIMSLTKADAERMGGKPVVEEKAATASNKARTAKNKSAGG